MHNRKWHERGGLVQPFLAYRRTGIPPTEEELASRQARRPAGPRVGPLFTVSLSRSSHVAAHSLAGRPRHSWPDRLALPLPYARIKCSIPNRPARISILNYRKIPSWPARRRVHNANGLPTPEPARCPASWIPG